MGTMCLSGVAVFKAGENMSSSLGETDYDTAILQAEAYVTCLARRDLSGAYAGLSPNVKYLLEEAVSNLAAIYLIQYDMSGYTSRVEAENMINILWARFVQCSKLIEDQNTLTYMMGA